MSLRTQTLIEPVHRHRHKFAEYSVLHLRQSSMLNLVLNVQTMEVPVLRQTSIAEQRPHEDRSLCDRETE
jgi:hypothetical protein